MTNMEKPAGVRPDLPPMPPAIARLPVDPKRGYPVPWFVHWLQGPDGKYPEFRIMDPTKFRLAIRDRLCWVCGEKLARVFAFVAGPMCAINRISAEPPSHLECAEWSVVACPFLARPHMERRSGGVVEQARPMAGMGLKRNPGVALIWMATDYTIVRDHQGRPLLHMGRPTKVNLYAEGRPAEREEITESIRTGLPFLRDVETTPGGLAELQRATARACKLLGVPNVDLATL